MRFFIAVWGNGEEDFVREVSLEPMVGRGILTLPSCIGRVGHKGGRVNLDRLEFDVKTRLRDRGCYCTTLFDFDGLPAKFPGKAAAASLPNVADKQRAVVKALLTWAEERLGRDIATKFLPYIQTHEFEALLFSDPKAFALAIGVPRLTDSFLKIRSKFVTPEDINDDPNTAPSKRIAELYPGYANPSSPVLAATVIGLETIRRECRLFDNWLLTIEVLGIGS